MCVNVEVTLPVLTNFIYSFSLRTGCLFTLLVTSIRNFFFLFFYLTTFLEIALHIHNPIAAYVLDIDKAQAPQDDDLAQIYLIFFTYQSLIISEVFLFVFTFHLLYGLINRVAHHLEYYLLCRFIVWLVELLALFLLCLRHKMLIAWYLFFLMICIMEVYLFMTVYSYYVNVLIDGEQMRTNYLKNIPSSPTASVKLGV